MRTLNGKREHQPCGSLLSYSFLRSFNPLRAREPAKLPSINERLKQDVADAALSMRFKGTTADDCRAWQKDFTTKLKALLGPHAPPAKWKTTVVSAKEFDDYRREELLLTAEGHPPLPVYLLVPRPKSDKRRPAILAIHGHGAHGHHPVAGRDDLPGVENAIKNYNYDYGRQLVRQGYVVAVPCLTPFGDRLGKSAGKTDACADVFIRMQLLGKTLIAEKLARLPLVGGVARAPCRSRYRPDRLRRVVVRRPYDDADDCVGASHQGLRDFGALNMMQERISRPYSCGAQIIPGLLQYGDVPEIASLIAPRPCLWEVGSEDKLIDATWADDILLRQRRAYKALNASAHLSIDRFEGGHVWHGKGASILLDKVLRR